MIELTKRCKYILTANSFRMWTKWGVDISTGAPLLFGGSKRDLPEEQSLSEFVIKGVSAYARTICKVAASGSCYSKKIVYVDSKRLVSAIRRCSREVCLWAEDLKEKKTYQFTLGKAAWNLYIKSRHSGILARRITYHCISQFYQVDCKKLLL